MDLFKPKKHTTTDTQKRKVLKNRIQKAASLTPHQAGKVTGAVFQVLGLTTIDSILDQEVLPVYTNRKPEDCAQAMNCIRCPNCAGCSDFMPVMAESYGPKPMKIVPKGIKEDPPFELDEDIGEVHLRSGSIILTPKEFELIRNPLQGAIKSATNEKINNLRKHMDKPEKVQELIKEILIVSELSFKLDKIK